jgi:hypothetical protein
VAVSFIGVGDKMKKTKTPLLEQSSNPINLLVFLH